MLKHIETDILKYLPKMTTGVFSNDEMQLILGPIGENHNKQFRHGAVYLY